MLLSDLINYGLYGLGAAALLLGGALGYKRGIGKQTIKLALMLGSIIFAFWVCIKIYPAIFNLLAGQPISELCATIGVSFDPTTTDIINSVDVEAAAYILAIPLTLVIVPLVSMLIFILAVAILTLPSMFICGMLGFGNKHNNIFTRIGGAVVGAVTFAVAISVVLAPAVGIVGVAKNAVTLAEKNYPDAANTVAIGNLYHQNIEPATENFVFKFIDSNFGYIYDEFTDIEMNGHEVQMERVAADVFEIFVLYGELGGADFAAPSPENQAIMREMVSVFGKDEFMTTIASGIMKSASTAIINGNVQLGIQEPMATFANALFSVFSVSDKTTIESDLNTVLNIYFTIAKAGALGGSGSQEEMFQSFLKQDESGNSIVNLILADLDANPRFSGVSTALSDFAMSMLMQNMGNESADVKETLDSVKGTLNTIVSIDKESYATEEEYKADVSVELDNTLKENGIELNEEQLSKVTDYVINEFDGKEEITDMDMALFMAKYYDVYGTTPEIPEDGTLPEIPDLGGDDDETPEIPDDVEIPDDFEIPEGVEIPDGVEIP